MNLLAFCSTDPIREKLHKPWSHGRWTYATDGRILIRVARVKKIEDSGEKIDGTGEAPLYSLPSILCPSTDEWPEPSEADLPCKPEPLLNYDWPAGVGSVVQGLGSGVSAQDARPNPQDRLGSGVSAQDARPNPQDPIGQNPIRQTPPWTPLPILDVSETNPCPNCHGRGTELPAMKCKECNGEGSVECFNCGHEEDCKRCKKTGWIDVPEGTPGAVIDPCETCCGKKTVPAKSYVTLGTQNIATGYYQLLTTLPDVRFTNSRGDYDAIPFTFTNGVGVLMPLRIGY